LIEDGRAQEAGEIIEHLQQIEASVDERDPVVAQAIAEMLRGYEAFRAGDLAEAEEQWASWRPLGLSRAIWKGDLYRERGDLEKAEDWYKAGWAHMGVHERLGGLYEEMGRPEDAAEAYERFITAWAEANEPLQERVEAARERREQVTAE